jgi:hypothetical protein
VVQQKQQPSVSRIFATCAARPSAAAAPETSGALLLIACSLGASLPGSAALMSAAVLALCAPR